MSDIAKEETRKEEGLEDTKIGSAEKVDHDENQEKSTNDIASAVNALVATNKDEDAGDGVEDEAQTDALEGQDVATAKAIEHVGNENNQEKASTDKPSTPDAPASTRKEAETKVVKEHETSSDALMSHETDTERAKEDMPADSSTAKKDSTDAQSVPLEELPLESDEAVEAKKPVPDKQETANESEILRDGASKRESTLSSVSAKSPARETPAHMGEQPRALEKQDMHAKASAAINTTEEGIAPLQVLSPDPIKSPTPSIADSTGTGTSGSHSAPPQLPRKSSSDGPKGWKGWLRSASTSAPSFSRRSTTITTTSIISESTHDSSDLMARFEKVKEMQTNGEYESGVDWQFWATVIASDRPRETEGIRQRIHAGIPDAIRGIVWQALSGSKDEALEQLYLELDNKETDFDKQIKKDTTRMNKSLLKSLEA
jgi:hypothetical protein